jgi:acetylglutamate kinase
MKSITGKPALTVIKIGGNVIDDEPKLDQFVQSFAGVEGHKLLVHGGGKLATQLAAQLNIPQQIIEGRRVTDEATLKVVTMVYAGYINKHITAKLQAAGCRAMGLSGTDADLVRAHKREHTTRDYGFAGDVDAVNGALVHTLLCSGLGLVVAPVTHDGKGQLLNTNADTIAREIAVAMNDKYETRLIYCFEKEGVLRDVSDAGSLIPVIAAADVANLEAGGIIAGGMIPKIYNAVSALAGGVTEVIIGKSDSLTQLVLGLSGTKIVHE